MAPNETSPEPAGVVTTVTEEAPPRAALAWDLAGGERLWLATQRRPWRSLAIVPGSDGLSTQEVARFITALGTQNGDSMGLADVRDVPLKRVSSVLALMSTLVDRGDRVVLAAGSIESLATVAFARAADCVILCASLGSTSISFVEDTIKMIGKERFLGSILLRPPGGEPKPFVLESVVPRLQAAS